MRGLLLALLLLGGCVGAVLPTPALPPLTTDTQREQARQCQQTYALCQGGCNANIANSIVHVNEARACTNTCKELLAACYQTLP